MPIDPVSGAAAVLWAWLKTPVGAKLLDTAINGVGEAASTMWAPVKAMSDVRADRIRAIGTAETALQVKALKEAKPAASTPVEITEVDDHDNAVDVEFDDSPVALSARAEKRLSYQEVKRQANLEDVLRETAEELRDVKEVGEQPVDDDWTARFFGHVQDVTNADMRRIWAKILAGEIVAPNSFSLRTLEILRNLSPDEAARFQKLADVTFNDDAIFKHELAAGLGISFTGILSLIEAGLVNGTEPLTLRIDRNTEPPPGCTIDFGDCVIVFNSEPWEPLVLNVYRLTLAGQELARVVRKKTNLDYVFRASEYLRGKHKNAIVTVYAVAGRTKDGITIGLPLNPE